MAAPHFPSPPVEDAALIAAKAAARLAMAERRQGMDPALGAALVPHFLNHFSLPAGATISGFWPMGDEIDIRPLLVALAERGHPIGLPVTGKRGEPLVFRLWRPGDALLPGRFGTSHPDGLEVKPAILLMPLLGFDRFGNRLGYGGGFYDRSLAQLPGALRIGCAFAAQEMPLVPTGPFDQKLNAILTETGVRAFPPPSVAGL
ncbi:5-formyltetrahydrofolate cyclo-ligase [Acidisoma cellulosilytica]|uniref:5-formyltetrahydrofolate cyclo-ligase n=1 Tax=Acidisoma cellulosilyticum TaxID=2802395 RepID=A0A964E5I3_9PROT|nr:5-formyltetrahydrofolate cyclo-ligase [Acidisoma cellulosilyticum]MCB8882467.1 5-formyltetrahydrofolate cyclo-ligase [Acidisoma cellulosilyticum]